MMQLHRNAAIQTGYVYRRRPNPCEVIQVHPLAMKEAQRIVRDFAQRGMEVRAKVQGDGSVVVRNVTGRKWIVA